MIIEILVGISLFLISILDYKFHRIPSFLTTTLILAVLIIYPQNIVYGIAGFVFGLMLYEFDFLKGRFFGGVADIKIMALIGLFINSWFLFASLMLLTGIFGLLTAVLRYIWYNSLQKQEPLEFPFIPVLFIIYIIIIIMRGILG